MAARLIGPFISKPEEGRGREKAGGAGREKTKRKKQVEGRRRKRRGEGRGREVGEGGPSPAWCNLSLCLHDGVSGWDQLSLWKALQCQVSKEGREWGRRLTSQLEEEEGRQGGWGHCCLQDSWTCGYGCRAASSPDLTPWTPPASISLLL